MARMHAQHRNAVPAGTSSPQIHRTRTHTLTLHTWCVIALPALHNPPCTVHRHTAQTHCLPTCDASADTPPFAPQIQCLALHTTPQTASTHTCADTLAPRTHCLSRRTVLPHTAQVHCFADKVHLQVLCPRRHIAKVRCSRNHTLPRSTRRHPFEKLWCFLVIRTTDIGISVAFFRMMAVFSCGTLVEIHV